MQKSGWACCPGGLAPDCHRRIPTKVSPETNAQEAAEPGQARAALLCHLQTPGLSQCGLRVTALPSHMPEPTLHELPAWDQMCTVSLKTFYAYQGQLSVRSPFHLPGCFIH